MWKDRSDKLGRVSVICVPACAHAFVRGRVPAPECVYLTRPAIRHPLPFILSAASGPGSGSEVGRGAASPVSYGALLSG